MQFKNLNDLAEQVATSDKIEQQLKSDPREFMRGLKVMNDKSVFLKVLYIVSSVLGISLISIVLWAFIKSPDDIPQVFITFGFTALGALVGLLVPNK